MDAQNLTRPAQNQGRGYVAPPVEEVLPERFFSVKFVLFSVLVLGAAGLGGAVQSGKISLSKYFSFGTPAVVAQVAPKGPTIPMPPAPADGTFVVTSISIGQPSFAIINGVAKVAGDALDAPGVTGWQVRAVLEDSVQIQNGGTVAALPLRVPGLKPLNDTLKPLN